MPFVAGGGLVIRGSTHAAVDANKLHHIFDFAKHGLDEVVSHFGSQEAAFRAIEAAAQHVVAERE